MIYWCNNLNIIILNIRPLKAYFWNFFTVFFSILQIVSTALLHILLLLDFEHTKKISDKE
jgi:hypothetical protein